MSRETDYRADSVRDAANMVEHFMDEIIEQLLDSEEASRDLYDDYRDGDSYHRENHVETDYSLSEAAELLDQLSEHEETDYALWEGLAPKQAITVQAAYTYGNAVMHHWRRLIRDINDAVDDDPVLTDMKSESDGGLTTSPEREIDRDILEERTREVVKETIEEYQNRHNRP